MCILRVAQALLALGILVTTAFIAIQYEIGGGGSPSQVNFLLFLSVSTLVLALPYLTFSHHYFPHAAHKFGIFAAEFVTMVFWFGGFIALAVFTTEFLGCSAPVCGAAQAATTFAAIEWVLFMISTVMSIVYFWTRNSNDGRLPDISGGLTGLGETAAPPMQT
ncbi:FAD/FMN-containing isoamyl alcohol oxidase MreA [Mycena venus]|uniref:FAD/FMN-containing isoamyl alcohol oxidase MreA n=1 Tax=Mycena venus TaxID=2733690 RepID=A0A8H6U372_9AGAR|nr:FAD/FMN-containing isoamyl alcohol oxidase MreA [Mycena venus]